MRSSADRGPLFALGAALLFGASTPVAKLLLGRTDPVLLAALFYFGSGTGLAIWRAATKQRTTERPLTRKDAPWLAGGIVAGGVIAPLALMLGAAKHACYRTAKAALRGTICRDVIVRTEPMHDHTDIHTDRWINIATSKMCEQEAALEDVFAVAIVVVMFILATRIPLGRHRGRRTAGRNV